MNNLFASPLMPGHPARKKLDELQQQIADLSAQSEAVKSAPAALADVRARLISAIERQGGAERYSFGGEGDLPDALTTAGPHMVRVPAITWGALCFLLFDGKPAALADRIIERAYTPAQYTPGLPGGERAAEIEKLSARIHQLGVAEEKERLALEAAGHLVLPRRDVDDKVLLEVWSAIKAPAKAA